MWGQNWRNILDIVKPYSETPDVTGEMMKQGYTPTKIFQVAEEFFTSLGLPPMSPEFWRNSIIQKPNDAYTQCSASAWDFCNLIDFRIKQCTQITLEDFINSHHEMTHIHVSVQLSPQKTQLTFDMHASSTTCSTRRSHSCIVKALLRHFTKQSHTQLDWTSAARFTYKKLVSCQHLFQHRVATLWLILNICWMLLSISYRLWLSRCRSKRYNQNSWTQRFIKTVFWNFFSLSGGGTCSRRDQSEWTPAGGTCGWDFRA